MCHLSHPTPPSQVTAGLLWLGNHPAGSGSSFDAVGKLADVRCVIRSRDFGWDRRCMLGPPALGSYLPTVGSCWDHRFIVVQVRTFETCSVWSRRQAVPRAERDCAPTRPGCGRSGCGGVWSQPGWSASIATGTISQSGSTCYGYADPSATPAQGGGAQSDAN